MLREYKELYKKRACLYEGWNTKGKSELVLEYLDPKKKDKESCLSAVFYRFWNLPYSTYFSQRKIIASENDCYDMLVTAIMYVLNNRPWEREDSSLYQDLKGPEKAIAIRYKSEKINFFVSCQRQKRTLNYNSLSLEALQENTSDSYFTPYYDKDTINNDYYKQKILNLFNEKDYFAAIVLDSIINFNFITSKENKGITQNQFNYTKLKQHLQSLDDFYIDFFIYNYGVDKEEITEAVNDIKNLNYNNLTRKLNRLFLMMRNDKELMQTLC